jgi:hypothetical protein
MEVTLSGSDLTGMETLWTSFPASVKRTGNATFQVRAKCSTGLGALRVAGSNGVSNLRFIAIDDLPTVAESMTNHAQASAQIIVAGRAVDGVCADLSCDWFRLRLKKGQRVSIETVAARLGSRLDSIVRVVGARGHELARNDDAPGQSGDSQLHFTAAATDDYFIEVRDANYSGGGAYFYRLRVGGSPLETTFIDSGLPGNASVKLEREPNDTVSQATRVSLPDTIQGRFDRAGDGDFFEFRANEGERWEFCAATRSIGSACDVLLELHAADGKRVARSNPSAADEGVLNYRFATGGVYRLMVKEAAGLFGPAMRYEIAARPAAGFNLTLDTDRVNVTPGKTFELKVNVVRGDHKGPITARVEGLPGAFILTNNLIAEGKTNVTLRVSAPGTLVAGSWQTFFVLGRARREGREVRVRASTAPSWRRQMPLRLHPPREFDGEVTLGVVAP